MSKNETLARTRVAIYYVHLFLRPIIAHPLLHYKQPALKLLIPRLQIASTKDCATNDPAAEPTK